MAAIARTEALNPALNGLAFQAFDRARTPARVTVIRRLLDGVPSFIKDNVAVGGMPDHAGHGRVGPRTRLPADGDSRKLYLATGLIPLGRWQMSEFGFCAAGRT